ncbi:hypothetical protein pdam_00001034 [Pocillopora damicornis]|uniref:Uncharacterized protein n=1 Tax=Pocillopora damicornis TaxID=46731 RepID=A0A3M6T6D5_POCDA|nr:hypothetical protein pdam_00001034 [Pocillopora damicornis]
MFFIYLFPQRVNLFIRFKPAIKVFLHIISFFLLSVEKFLIEHMKWRATGKISKPNKYQKKGQETFSSGLDSIASCVCV